MDSAAGTGLDRLLAEYDEMLTIDDITRILKVTRSAVVARLGDPEDPIPSYRVGKSIRVQKADLRDWMLRQRRG